MRTWTTIVGLAALAAGLGCVKASVTRTGRTGSGAALDEAAAPVPVSTRKLYTRADTVRPRRVPNYAAQDSTRKATIARILATLAGRENEPAGRVFKNVQLHKDLPVREFLAKMDEQYGRGLSMTCTNCHVAGRWESDSLKNKVIARQMETMTRAINVRYLEKVPQLDEDFPQQTCVMCHRGAAHPPNVMVQPTGAR